MQPLAAISSQWIDATGETVDLKARLGRLGDDVSAYALHTLGWVRIVQISRYSEFSFDARSARDLTIEALIDALRRHARFDSHQLLRIEVYDGENWQQQTSSDVESLVRFVQYACARASAGDPAAVLHQIPYSIDRIWTLGDPQVRAVAEAWRSTAGLLTDELDTAIGRDCPDRSVKVMVPTDSTFRFDRYRSSPTGPWDRNVWDRFIGETVRDIVPDRSLATSVTRAGELVLRSRTPRLERCKGPVLATEGIRNFAWYRISLPVWLPDDDRTQTPHGVLMVLSPDWREDEAA